MRLILLLWIRNIFKKTEERDIRKGEENTKKEKEWRKKSSEIKEIIVSE